MDVELRSESGMNRRLQRMIAALAAATLLALLGSGCGRGALHAATGGNAGAHGKPATVTTRPTPSVAQSSLATTDCPRDDVQRSLTSRRPGAHAAIVPADAVALTLCDYNDANLTDGTPQNALLSRAQVRKLTTVTRLAKAINAVKRSAANAAEMDCVMYFGQMIAYFHYRTGVDDIVKLDVGGCGIVSNGHLARMGNVEALLARYTRRVELVWPTIAGRCLSVCHGTATRNEGLAAYIGRTLISSTKVSWRGRFRAPLATPGHYRFEIVHGRKNTPVAVGYARLRTGHTTHVVLRPLRRTS